uniref:Uncharacterized protein n=1 Tax=Anguilla anguilla TaxID=7936 RepID=A0A0E9WQK2_ANGAN
MLTVKDTQYYTFVFTGMNLTVTRSLESTVESLEDPSSEQ